MQLKNLRVGEIVVKKYNDYVEPDQQINVEQTGAEVAAQFELLTEDVRNKINNSGVIDTYTAVELIGQIKDAKTLQHRLVAADDRIKTRLLGVVCFGMVLLALVVSVHYMGGQDDTTNSAVLNALKQLAVLALNTAVTGQP